MCSGQAWTVQNYDKKIKYLDYMENGVRARGAGFVRLERRGRFCSINLQISGLYRRDRFTRPLLLLDGSGERELCRLQVAEGGVSICMDRLDSDNLDGQGLKYEEVVGLRVPVSEGKEIRCLWGAKGVPHVVTEPTVSEVSEAPAVPSTPTEPTEEAPPEDFASPVTESISEPPVQTEPPENGAEPVMLDDKWEQLWEIYPHIAPFHDEREYMSMGPGDFVILPGRYYKLVNNSFLLHGYYNYRHLIMSRVKERNNTKYYIGVPGNYYEREKKIAVMFGFESFECSAEPAEEGDFGYYLIPVEL